MIWYHLAKFGGHKYCSSGDKPLVCHVIKQDHIIQGWSDYNNTSPSR